MEFFGVVVMVVVFALVQFAMKQSGKESEDDSFSGDSPRRRPRSSRPRPRPQTAQPTTLEEALQLAEDRDPIPTMRYAGLEDAATEESSEKNVDAPADEHEVKGVVGDEVEQEVATGSAAGPGEDAVPAESAVMAESAVPVETGEPAEPVVSGESSASATEPVASAAPVNSTAPLSTTPLSPSPQRAVEPLGEALETSTPVYTPTSVYAGYTPTSLYTSGSARLFEAGADAEGKGADEADTASPAEENRG